MKNKSIWFYMGGGIALCFFLTLLVYLYLDYTTAKAMPTIPQVSILGTYPEDTATANQSVIVFGQAEDPDGIAEVQLWVNGRMVASQENPDKASEQPFEVSQAWVPTGSANYLAMLRAIDRKGNTGQSDPVMIEVNKRTYTYEMKEGETIENVAENLGMTPREIQTLNPGIGGSPPAGMNLDVPGISSEEGSGEGGEIPHVNPPADPLPPSGEEIPAEPAPTEFWRYILPDNFVCLFNPDACSASSTDETLSPPVNVGAALNDSCQVLVGWQDTTDGELGFRVYRVARRPFRYDMVALLRASPGTGARLSYLDETPPNQEFFYFVAAYNARGEFWSAPSQTITVSCRPSGLSAGWSLEIEALDMMVRDSYDRLYCYVSLTGLPFERVPGGSQFIELEGGTWNIARHFSGVNKRAIFSNGDPIDIIAECLGWQGDTLINLGRFTRSHPREEWDGRHLTAGPPDGSFNVTYHIQPFNDTEDEVGRSVWDLIDASVPPPYNLRTAVDYRLTSPTSDPDIGSSAQVSGDGLAWDYTAFEGDSRPPVDFRVYYRGEGDSRPTFYHQTNSGTNMTAPQKNGLCHETIFYSVSAVVGIDPSTGEIIESPPSEELEVPPSCGTLEITLNSLHTLVTDLPIDGEFLSVSPNYICFDDCGQVVEAYGFLQFNNYRIRWNRHCDGCTIGRSSEITSIPEGSVLQWSDLSLSNSGGFFGQNQNVFTIPIRDHQPLVFAFEFFDHDSVTSDDRYCESHEATDVGGIGGRIVIDGRGLEAWRAVDQDITFTAYRCEIAFHVRGVR